MFPIADNGVKKLSHEKDNYGPTKSSSAPVPGSGGSSWNGRPPGMALQSQDLNNSIVNKCS